MKKTIVLVIICLLTMSLTACGSANTAELDELRQQVESLETRVSELEKSESIVTEEVSIPEEETTVSSDAPTEATESNTTTVENNTQMSEYLDNQVKSSDPVNWLEVADCEVATEKNLLEVAEKCASISYYYYTSDNKSAAVNIANALSENPNSTDNVMKTLTDSEFPDVWLVVANSAKSKEGALQSAAEKCASINYYHYTSDNKSAAVNIANALSENPNSTDNVMKTLTDSEFPDVWLVVANSAKSKEGALQSAAKKCASINYYYYTSDNNSAAVNIANALSENPNSTKTALQELVNSAFPDVVSIGHQWIEGQP